MVRREQAKGSCIEDAQDLADYMLDVDVRLGELLGVISPKYVGSIEGTHVPKQEKSLPLGISKAVSHQAQTLSVNKDIVEKVKTEAREGRHRE